MPAARKVLIVGGGIGGLTAACALRLHGFEVMVCERSPRLAEVGAGLQLGPNAVKVLRTLDLEEALRRVASELHGAVSLDGRSGRLRYRDAMGGEMTARFGAPYLAAHRADVQALLLERLPDGTIEVDAQCTGTKTSGHVAVALFADGREVEADLIVGADGIRSAVRESLFGHRPARFTGQMGWRGIVPIARAPARVGPQRSVEVRPDEFAGWIDPTGHVICYPIRRGELYNVFAGHVTDVWAEESWTVSSSREEMLAAFAGWNDDLLDLLGAIDECFKWGIHDRDPLPTWTAGRVTLLGDAAHPMMPTLAQGAAMAMEDALALARALAAHPTDLPLALAEYEAARVARASRVQLQARVQFENNRLSPPPPALDRSWIFEHDPAL
jgi:salicylate hydroxylase